MWVGRGRLCKWDKIGEVRREIGEEDSKCVGEGILFGFEGGLPCF